MFVYIGGPIDSVDVEYDHSWRAKIKNAVPEGSIAYDPQGAFTIGFTGPANHETAHNWHMLVEVNSAALLVSDVMIAADPHRSVGTAREMERFLAHHEEGIVITWSTQGDLPNSPYLLDQRIRKVGGVDEAMVLIRTKLGSNA